MKTITISSSKSPANTLVLPVVSVEDQISGNNDELHLIEVNSKPFAAIMCDDDQEAIEWLQSNAFTLPNCPDLHTGDGDHWEGAFTNVELTQLEQDDILALENKELPLWDTEHTSSWTHELPASDEPSAVVILALHQNVALWCDQLQHDACNEDNEEYPTATLDGTTTMVLDSGNYDAYEDDQARDQVVDMIDDCENDTLKTLLNRNLTDLIADFKAMPEFDPKYATNFSFREESYQLIDKA